MEEHLLGFYWSFFDAYLQNIPLGVFGGIPAVSRLHRGQPFWAEFLSKPLKQRQRTATLVYIQWPMSSTRA